MHLCLPLGVYQAADMFRFQMLVSNACMCYCVCVFIYPHKHHTAKQTSPFGHKRLAKLFSPICGQSGLI